MLICVTNRKLCKDDFLQRINQLALGNAAAIMLREKDLNQAEFESLAIKVKEICERNQVPLIVNQNIKAATKLKLPNIHLSIGDLRNSKKDLHPFRHIGASVHSVSEAIEAQSLGADYLIAGHIFSTDCKKGVPPRGLSFLKEVCDAVSVPVFAIGGITCGTRMDIAKTGAKGMCLMSEAMICKNPLELTSSFHI